MKKEIHLAEKYKNHTAEISELIDRVENSKNPVELSGLKINIKPFKNPSFFNRIGERFFGKSVAENVFQNVGKLLKKGIGTPPPVAFVQKRNGLLAGKSYYLSEHLSSDFTYGDVLHDQTFPNRHEILKQFASFTFKLHENGIEFLDHSPGNTLIKVNEKNGYDFFLINLKRIKFRKKMNYKIRINNFKQLTSDKMMVATLSGEYAKLSGEDYHQVFSDMWKNASHFQG